MNRLIIIGNGFDLANGLKTSYPDFIRHYFKNAIKKASNELLFSDILLKISKS
jgi:hypothetical protein